MNRFGNHLKEERELRNISQKSLAVEIGTSRNSICVWERGECMPNLSYAIKIANLFGISLDLLVGRYD